MSCNKCDTDCMRIAHEQQKKSQDPKTQVGACVRSEQGDIIGLGYNCMPAKKDDVFPWVEGKNDDVKHFYVCHAELNAIVDAYRSNASAVANATIYCTLHPCHQCAKLIAQAGIKRVCFEDNKHREKRSTMEAVRIFAELQIVCEQLPVVKFEVNEM